MPKKEKGLSKLSFQERRAAQIYANGFDVDGEPVTTKREVAKRCGLTDKQLYDLFQRQDFCDEVDKHITSQKNASARELMHTLPAAIRRLQKIIEEGSDREALQAASKIIGLAGFSEHKVIDVNVTNEVNVVRGGYRNNELDFVDADYESVDEEDEEDL